MNDTAESRPTPRRWGFLGAVVAILLALVAGQAIGILLERFPPSLGLSHWLRGDRIGAREAWSAMPGSLALGDWVFAAFLAVCLVYAIVQRRALARFFRSMTVGVSLVVLSTLAVTAGVLVPQIEGFEDPDARVGVEGTEQWENHYRTFRFAEGYFFYHLLHPYGVGMPSAEIPAAADEGLRKFGQRYGSEEEKNRRKMMEAAFAGPQISDEIEDFCNRHENALKNAFRVCTALDLNRTYKSHWFAALLTMLGVAVFFNTFRGDWRRWFTLEKCGFVVTHFGMMTILVGGLTSKLSTDRGIMHLDLRDPTPQDTYYRHFDMQREARMPFFVRLDRFGRKDWRQVEVYFRGDDFTSRVPQYTLWPDRTIDLDFAPDDLKRERPRLRLHVKELADHAKPGSAFVREAYDAEKPADILPIAELDVAVTDEHGHVSRDRRHLSPQLPRHVYYDPANAFRLKAAYGAGLDETPTALFPSEEGVLGTIELSLESDADEEPERRPFKLGDRFELADGWAVSILRATANFDVGGRDRAPVFDERPLDQQAPTRPAIYVQIHPPYGKKPVERLLISGVDWRDFGAQDRLEYPQVLATFEWDLWRAPGPPRYVLQWSAGVAPKLLGEDGVAKPATASQPLPLEGGEPVVLLQTVHKASFEPNIEFLHPGLRADGFDESFYSRDPRGVEIEVIRNPGTSEESREVAKLATHELYEMWHSKDGDVALRFFENTNMLPFEWRSVLTVLERGDDGRLQEVDLGPEPRREIRVNDYFEHRGYRFFQTNASAEAPTYSGIGVVWDPGIEIVLLGMYTVIAGTVLAFIVRPIARSRREAKEAA